MKPLTDRGEGFSPQTKVWVFRKVQTLSVGPLSSFKMNITNKMKNQTPSIEQITALLPQFWSIDKTSTRSQKSKGYRFLITECDEPTFFVDPTLGIEWVKPVEELEAEFAEDDSEMASTWREEAEEVFAKIAALFVKA